MSNVVELDTNDRMTVKQAFRRAEREIVDKVIIIGLDSDNKLKLITSDMNNMEAFWFLHIAADIPLNG